jgi:hypothetical protein
MATPYRNEVPAVLDRQRIARGLIAAMSQEGEKAVNRHSPASRKVDKAR